MEPVKQVWKTGRDRELFAWQILPTTTPKAVVMLVHGLGEYSWRYKNWAKKFAYEGFVFQTWDHWGYGISDPQNGFNSNYEQFLLEIDLALTKVNQQFPSLPTVLYGQGMGGTIAINYCIRRTSPIDMLVLTSPVIESSMKQSKLKRISRVLLSLVPGITVKESVNPEYLTHEPEVVKRYRNDKLINPRISPHLLLMLSKSAKYAMHNANRIKIPTLIMHGSGNQIASCEASMRLANSMPNATFIEWPGQYHELHHESNQNEIFLNIREWILQNLTE